MRVIRMLVPLLFAFAFASSCSSEAPEVALNKKLVEKRFEQKQLLDELYQKYGSGELAGAVKQEAEQEAAEQKDPPAGERNIAKEFMKAVGNAALELDRAAFDRHCLTVGRGKHAPILSEKGKAFFAEGGVQSKCKAVAELEIEIDAVEDELARLGKQQRAKKE